MKNRIFILSIVMGVFLLASCTQNNATQDNQRNENLVVEQSSYEEDVNMGNQEIASHLATIATEVPDVNDAAAIVAGPYAVVGIDIDEATERQRVGTIKYSVNEALQKDPYGKTAVVVADADITERIREMTSKVQEGYPVTGVIDELSEIVGRYMPSFPVPENRPQDEDENKDKVTDEEQEKLEDIQQDQSNQR